jgi:hypothetical protein
MVEGVFNFSSEADKGRLYQLLRRLRGAQRVEIKRYRKPRSNNANAYYWGVVIPHVTEGIGEAWGEGITHEETHEFLKAKFLSRPVVDRVTGEKKGDTVGSTSRLDTEAFGEYVNRCVAFAAEYLQTEIPAPGEMVGV